MEIIKKGSLPRKLIGTCYNCGCVAEFGITEAKPVSYYPDVTCTGYEVKCPTENCGGVIYAPKDYNFGSIM